MVVLDMFGPGWNIEWDEYVEVTPDAIRLRKIWLTENERKRNTRMTG